MERAWSMNDLWSRVPIPTLGTHIAQICELGIHFHSLLLWQLGVFVIAASATYPSCYANKVLQMCCKKTHINTASLKFLFPTIYVSWALEHGFQLLHQPTANTIFSVAQSFHSLGALQTHSSLGAGFLAYKHVRGEDSLDFYALLPALVRTPGCGHSSSTSPPAKMIHSRLKGWSQLSIILTGGRVTSIKWRELDGRKLY